MSLRKCKSPVASTTEIENMATRKVLGDEEESELVRLAALRLDAIEIAKRMRKARQSITRKAVRLNIRLRP